MNSLIEKIFEDFKVDNKSIPISFLNYQGKATSYITYQRQAGYSRRCITICSA